MHIVCVFVIFTLTENGDSMGYLRQTEGEWTLFRTLCMIFKPPLYLLPCSCTSQIHASSSFNHAPTCICLFIKCQLHCLGQANLHRHTCIWDVSVIFQVWCVSPSDCSIGTNGDKGACLMYLKLYTCLCPLTTSSSPGLPCLLLCSMHTPFATT